jgi:phosphoribosylanthranilate isomerase
MILKICGITNQEDASAAIDAGATAVGFNFYSRSPRYLAPEQAGEIVTAAGVRRVGVFVNQTRERVEEIAGVARLDVAQLHGNETVADYPGGLKPAPPVHVNGVVGRALARQILVWKALRVDASFNIALYEANPAEALLLDGPAGDLYGGAGKSFDWSLVRQTDRKIVLAGGLDASNVADAIELVRPWGVDCCSRIESAPGRKDHKKMSEFLQAAMAAARA